MKGSILEIVDHGHFLGVDSEKLDECNNEISDKNSKFFSYVVMPRFSMNLQTLFKNRCS